MAGMPIEFGHVALFVFDLLVLTNIAGQGFRTYISKFFQPPDTGLQAPALIDPVG